MNLRTQMMILSMAIFFTGCAATNELDRSAPYLLAGSGFARITTDCPHDHAVGGIPLRVAILNIDNKNLYRMGSNSDYPESMLIKPGERKIVMRHKVSRTYFEGEIVLDVKAEQSYIVKSRLEPSGAYFWVEDSSRNKVGPEFGPFQGENRPLQIVL